MKRLKSPFLIFIVFGIASVVFYYFYHDHSREYDWVETQAQIDSTEYKTTGDYNYLLVYYSFEVNGKSYTGSGQATNDAGEELLFLKKKSTSKSAFEDFLKKEKFNIFYNPDEPTESVSFPEVNMGLLVGAIFSAVLSFLGLLGMITAYRNQNRKSVID